MAEEKLNYPDVKMNPFDKEGKSEREKNTPSETSAFVNRILETIDGIRVGFVNGDQEGDNGFRFVEVGTKSKYSTYDEKGKVFDKSTKNEKNKGKDLVFIEISNDITYSQFARLLKEMQNKLNEKYKNNEHFGSIEEIKYQGLLLRWQAGKIEEMAGAISGNEEANQGMLKQAQEYKQIANILLEEGESEFEEGSLYAQRLEQSKQIYEAGKWKRDLLVDYANSEYDEEKRDKLKKRLKSLKGKIKRVKEQKLDLTQEHGHQVEEKYLIEDLLNINNKKKEGVERLKNLTEAITKITGGNIKEKMEEIFLDLSMESGIRSVADNIFEKVEREQGEKIEDIEDLAEQIKSEEDIAKKVKLEKELAWKINQIVYNQDIFEPLYTDGKNKTESIQTFAELNRDNKYQVQCTTRVLLQKMFWEKYLNRNVLAGSTTGHFIGVLELSDGGVLSLDWYPKIINYDLEKGGLQHGTGYGQYGYNSSQNWLLVGDFNTLFKSQQSNSLAFNHAYQGKYKLAKEYYLKACQLTNWSNPHYINDLATTYICQGKYKLAEKYFLQVNKMTNWDEPKCIEGLAYTYRYQGEFEKAEKYAQKTLELLRNDEKNRLYKQAEEIIEECEKNL